jgi:hypothetical protein
MIITSTEFLKAFRFAVEIEGLTSTSFSEVTPAEVAGPGTLPTPLRRGMRKDNDELAEWAATPRARAVTVIIMDRDGKEVRRRTLGKCTPIQYVVGPFNNNSDDVAMEEITIRRLV